jgi:hypothetical protein
MSGGYTAVVIHLPDDDGQVTIRKVEVPAGDQAGLRFLQDTVKGYIEAVDSADHSVTFWVNEEGKLEQLPVNDAATDLLWAMNPAFVGQDVLVGDVALTSHKGPETASIPDGFWEQLQSLNWEIPITWVEGAASEHT